MYSRNILVVGVSVAVMVGCVTSQSVQYKDAPVFDRYPQDYRIDIYVVDDAPAGLQRALDESLSLNDVPSSAIALGRIDVQGWTSWSVSVGEATAKARRWGGDAIVIDRATRKQHESGRVFELSAEVIRYRDDAEQISDSEDEQEAGGD